MIDDPFHLLTDLTPQGTGDHSQVSITQAILLVIPYLQPIFVNRNMAREVEWDNGVLHRGRVRTLSPNLSLTVINSLDVKTRNMYRLR